MRQKLKIGLTVVYTVIFLAFAGTGALQTQAAEEPLCAAESLTLMVTQEKTDFFCSAWNLPEYG
jgi:hypothetical protein